MTGNSKYTEFDWNSVGNKPNISDVVINGQSISSLTGITTIHTASNTSGASVSWTPMNQDLEYKIDKLTEEIKDLKDTVKLLCECYLEDK